MACQINTKVHISDNRARLRPRQTSPTSAAALAREQAMFCLLLPHAMPLRATGRLQRERFGFRQASSAHTCFPGWQLSQVY
jgi:hypothetical protein